MTGSMAYTAERYTAEIDAKAYIEDFRRAVKLEPEAGERLREQYEGVRPAYHMNKKHWSDLILERLDDSFVKEQIKASYNLVVSKLPKKYGIKIKE